jgi:membrane protease YdiL (CAAX protease family)
MVECFCTHPDEGERIWNGKSFTLPFREISIDWYLLDHYSAKPFVTLLLAALLEDLLHRGLVLRILEQWLGSSLALALAISIEMLHFTNNNVEFNYLNLCFFILWGFNQGILYIYTKRIWLPFAFQRTITTINGRIPSSKEENIVLHEAKSLPSK